MELRLRLRQEMGKRKKSDFAFQEINQAFESQQFQLHQISLHGELEMRNRLFQESRARIREEIEELRRICCEETDQARQARSEETSMQQQRNPRILSQMMAQIWDLLNKVNS